MKIQKFPFAAAHRIMPGQRIDGTITHPEGAKLIHIGSELPSGEMFAFYEVSPVAMPDVTKEVVVLKEGDEIPNGYVYVGYILASPLLFIYEKQGIALLT